MNKQVLKNSNVVNFTAKITKELSNLRLDTALVHLYPQYSRSCMQQWIKEGYVTLDDKNVNQRTKVKEGQIIHIDALLPQQISWEPEEIPLNIIYEDDAILIINKPVGFVVHPGAGNKSNTLSNALLHYAPELAKVPRTGIIHRLDKDTSGLLVIARNLTAHHSLTQQMQKRSIKRVYQALVNGIIISGGTIKTSIGRHPIHRTKMAVLSEGRLAITHYRVRERFRAHTLLQIELETGRTHQIRVHMAHIHHAIVGDQVYGYRLKLPANASDKLKTALQSFKHQALHAWRLAIIHPKTKKVMSWEAPLPEDMQYLIELLHKDITKYQ